jgi:hypothetical protein
MDRQRSNRSRVLEIEPARPNLRFRTAVEPYFRGRTTYKSKATHNELGQDFFPEGSLRVYVGSAPGYRSFATSLTRPRFQALLAKIPEQLVKIMRLDVWQGIMSRFLK